MSRVFTFDSVAPSSNGESRVRRRILAKTPRISRPDATKKILEYFASHPRAKLYTHEIADRTGIGRTRAHAIIKRLANEGHLVRRDAGNGMRIGCFLYSAARKPASQQEDGLLPLRDHEDVAPAAEPEPRPARAIAVAMNAENRAVKVAEWLESGRKLLGQPFSVTISVC